MVRKARPNWANVSRTNAMARDRIVIRILLRDTQHNTLQNYADPLHDPSPSSSSILQTYTINHKTSWSSNHIAICFVAQLGLAQQRQRGIVFVHQDLDELDSGRTCK